jgi:hypothetical protein
MFDIDNMSGLIAILAVILVFGTPIIIVIAIPSVHKAHPAHPQTVVALAERACPFTRPVCRPARHRQHLTVTEGRRAHRRWRGTDDLSCRLRTGRDFGEQGMIPLLIGVGYLIVWTRGQEGRQGMTHLRPARIDRPA